MVGKLKKKNVTTNILSFSYDVLYPIKIQISRFERKKKKKTVGLSYANAFNLDKSESW